MKTSDFDYHLPESLIAQTPVEPRSVARLLVLDRHTGRIEHRIFGEIGDYLQPGDLLIANSSRVIPARLPARKWPSGGKVELLLLSRRDELTWEALVQGRKTPVGTRLALWPAGQGTQPALIGEVLSITLAGGRLVRWERPIEPLLDQIGQMPLPPYIHTPLADPERYQTVYAQQPGSAAAPTAGLHFTSELIASLRGRGIRFSFVTLDIGLDTFRPVETENVQDHHIHTERCTLSTETVDQIAQTRAEGRRVIAVGTTSVRVLETAACGGEVRPFSGPTNLFIYPGFEFRVIDALITNFHLPRSSLLMLVSAFTGRERILQAYQQAIEQSYRFFSLGDAMLIL